MNENKLPMFRPSKLGLSNDLRIINYEQQRGAGWWKGQLVKYFDILAPVVNIDGYLCYNNGISLGANTCYKESIPAYFKSTVHYNLDEPDLDEYINNIKQITNGSFSFIADGEYVEVLNLDFSNVNNYEDIANIVNAGLVKHTFESVSTTLLNEVDIVSKLFANIPGEYSSIGSLNEASAGSYVGGFILPNYEIVAGVNATDNNVISFLRLFGIDDDGLSELCSTYHDSAVDDVLFSFVQTLDFEQDDFNYIFEEINNAMVNVSKVEISYVETYIVDVEPPTITETKNARFPDLYNDLITEGRPTVRFYNEIDVDITADILPDIVTAVGSMLFCSSELLYTLESISEVRDYYTESTIDYVDITITEVYSTPRLSLFYNEYNNYINAYKYIEDSGFTNYEYFDNYANDFWKVRDSFLILDGLLDDVGLFVRKGKAIYLSVEGLKNANPASLSYYLNQYADFAIDKASVPWYKKIVNFFLSLIVSIINVLSGLAIAIPGIRQIVQSLVWLFNGQEWITDDAEIKQYASIVTIAVISIAYGIFTRDAKGSLTLYEYLSVAINVTSMGLSIGEASESIAEQKEQEALEKLEKELIENEPEEIEKYEDAFGATNQFLVLDRMIEEQGYDSYNSYDQVFEIKY